MMQSLQLCNDAIALLAGGKILRPIRPNERLSLLEKWLPETHDPHFVSSDSERFPYGGYKGWSATTSPQDR